MNSPKIAKFVLWCLCATLVSSGCVEMGELQKPVASPYYGEIAPAPSGEFRWANGELPKTFDPALAASSSEMQAVRAAFDGLTEWDKQSLEAVPALAERWNSSEDARTWTFYLRPNAIWSNGKRITAQDFVRSWQRLKDLGANSPNQQLISNIVGAKNVLESKTDSSFVLRPSSFDNVAGKETNDLKVSADDENKKNKDKGQRANDESWFGVEALSDSILRVYLKEPDKDFPRLAGHSALRPVFADGDEFDRPESAAKIVTSGAFRLVSCDKSGVVLERSKTYWNFAAVKIERLRFVPTKNAESALAAYRAGEVDAVTNARIEPLALKLLASYRDFERTTYNAVTFYEFNQVRAPFNDHRVREALTIALDRERLANDELDGATFPAKNFLPRSTNAVFKFDPKRAQNLLTEAGFPNGKNFPKIRLLVNRNDAQHRLAKAVAVQWQKNLGIETEIVNSSLEDLENTDATKDFDLVRRSVVLPTTDETASLQAMFERKQNSDADFNLFAESPVPIASPDAPPSAAAKGFPIPLPSVQPIEDAPQIGKSMTKPDGKLEVQTNRSSGLNQPKNQSTDQSAKLIPNKPADFNGFIESGETPPILTETQAIDEIPAIPLYFPSSYALVKPYIIGFEPNLLDAPVLKDVEIQANWQPPQN